MLTREAIQTLWSRTVGDDADWDGLSSLASYRPASDDSLLEDDRTLPRAFAEVIPGPRGPGQAAFESREEIGRGGMGVVYRARQHSLERDVALKKMRRKRSKRPSSGLARAAFITEALITGGLDHPNIVPVYDLGYDAEGCAFMAMKLVGGRSWSALLREQPDALELHLETLIQVCNAVAFAHSRGIVHNDLKPSNVMLGAFGEVLLMDWGLAVGYRAGHDVPGLRDKSSISSPAGTPAYMPPELALGEGRKIGTWTDVYLLGAILHELLTGAPPHQRGRFIESLAAAAEGKRPPLDPGLPAELRALVERALCPDQAERIAEVRVFQRELRDYLRHKESLAISRRADQRLGACRARAAAPETPATELYEDFAGAVSGFEQARELWAENELAREGVEMARRAYAEAALARGDLGLAETQAARLENDRTLVETVRRAQHERAAAKVAARRLRRFLIGAVAVLVVALSAGLLFLSAAHNRLSEQHQTIATQFSTIEAAHRAIAAEQEATELQRQVAVERGRIAETALDDLMEQVNEKLLDQGSAATRQLAEQIMGTALEGYRALRDSDLASRAGAVGAQRVRLAIARVAMFVDGDSELALTELDTAARNLRALEDEDPEARTLLTEVLYERARVRHSVGRIADAGADYGAALARLPDAAAPLVGEGEVWRRDAPGLFRVEIVLDFARLLGDQGQLGKADELLRAALPLARNTTLNKRLLMTLGTVAHQRGQHHEARDRFSAAVDAVRVELDLFGETAPRLEWLAIALLELGEQLLTHVDPDGARVACAEAVALARRLRELDPRSQQRTRQLVRALTTLAETERSLGAFEAASELCTEALGLLTELRGRDPENVELAGQASEVLRCRARLRAARGQVDAALDSWDEAIGLMLEQAPSGPGLVDLGDALRSRGVLRVERGLIEGAFEDYEAACAVLGELLERDPDASLALRTLGQVLTERARLYLQRGQFWQALDDAVPAVEIFRARSLSSDDAALQLPGAGAVSDLAVGLGILANVHGRLGDVAEAHAAALESVALHRELLARAPSHHLAGYALARSLGVLGETELQRGAHAAGLEALEEGITLFGSLLGDDPGNVPIRRDYGLALCRLGDLHYDAGDFDAACELYEAALAELEPMYIDLDLALGPWLMVAERVGGTRDQRGDTSGAAAIYSRALDMLAARGAPAAQRAMWSSLLSELERRESGDPGADARDRATADELLAALQSQELPPSVAREAWIELGNLYLNLDDHAGIVLAFARAIALGDEVWGEGRPPIARLQRAQMGRARGLALQDLDKLDEARAVLEEARTRALALDDDKGLAEALRGDLWQLTKQELAEGLRAPESAEEWLSYGLIELSRGHGDSAAAALRTGLADPVLAQNPAAWLTAARDCARLGAGDPDLEALSVELLEGWAALWSARVAALREDDPDGELAGILAIPAGLRAEDAFAGVRERADFRALFERLAEE